MQDETREARARGLRMAIQVAALGAVLLAAAPAGGDAEASTIAGPSVDLAGLEARDAALDAMLVRSAKKCGCTPCWGPPAPPPAALDEVRRFEAWAAASLEVA